MDLLVYVDGVVLSGICWVWNGKMVGVGESGGIVGIWSSGHFLVDGRRVESQLLVRILRSPVESIEEVEVYLFK